MELKQYQTGTLDVLRRFFEEARIGGAKNAYEAVTREPGQSGRLGSYGGTYRPLSGLPEVPYVWRLLRIRNNSHQYAVLRYEELTGWKAPAAGGPRQRSLTGARRRIDGDARRKIAEELGHRRASVVGIYAGT